MPTTPTTFDVLFRPFRWIWFAPGRLGRCVWRGLSWFGARAREALIDVGFWPGSSLRLVNVDELEVGEAALGELVGRMHDLARGLRRGRVVTVATLDTVEVLAADLQVVMRYLGAVKPTFSGSPERESVQAPVVRQQQQVPRAASAALAR